MCRGSGRGTLLTTYKCTCCGHETQDSYQKHCEFCGETEWETIESDDESEGRLQAEVEKVMALANCETVVVKQEAK
jgi:hypothetical protein